MDTAFTHLLAMLGGIADPRRAEGKLYGLPHVFLFSILAVMAGANSYRAIHTFIDVHLHRLKETFELNWRRAPAYHARFMRPIKVGSASADDQVLAERLIEIQDAALAQVAPGVPETVPDEIYRQGVLEAGLAERYTNRTFYFIGLMLAPTGGEKLDASPEATWDFEAGMTLHTYVLARDFGMSETILITDSGYERLTHFPRELIIGGI